MRANKKILVAPLNWGLGHASRCIPIINGLLENNYIPILASDGVALQLLQKEFPSLDYYLLPSYQITYPKKGNMIKLSLMRNSLTILDAVNKEKKMVKSIVDKEKITGIISDNRFGVRSSKVPSVYMTHQVSVLSGITSLVTSLVHQKIISKFDACWIPDYDGPFSLSGKLSSVNSSKSNHIFIGPLSRFSIEKVPKKYDLLVILSGPEPQRTSFEKRLLNELKKYKDNVLFVQGLIEKNQRSDQIDNIKIVNYMLSGELEKSINESKIVLARSGYSTIMDLENLDAKAFFIPTPGQSEQEYLAHHLKLKKIAPSTSQDNFKIEMLEKTAHYDGFSKNKQIKSIELSELFKNYF